MLHLSTHILFDLRADLSKIFWKASTILNPFKSFKETTQAYFLKILIKHKKNLIPLLNLHINCILAKSAPQILSLNPEQTILFLIFLIIGLCKSSVDCKFCLISLLAIPIPDTDLSGSEPTFYQKIRSYRSKPSLITIIFRIFSNIKCFIS